MFTRRKAIGLSIVSAIAIASAVRFAFRASLITLPSLERPSLQLPGHPPGSQVSVDALAKARHIDFAPTDPSLRFIEATAKETHRLLSTPKFEVAESLFTSYGLPPRPIVRRDNIEYHSGEFSKIAVDWAKAEYSLVQDGAKQYYVPLEGRNMTWTSLEYMGPSLFESAKLKLPKSRKVILCKIPAKMPASFEGKPDATLFMYFTDVIPNVKWGLFRLGIQCDGDQDFVVGNMFPDFQ